MPSPLTLTTASLFDLEAELAFRQHRVAVLLRQRERVLKQLATLDALIARIEETRAEGRPRGRVDNGRTLSDALVVLLTGRTMSVAESARALIASGHKTSNAAFKVAVNGALLDKARFRRLGYGKYTAK